MDFSTLFGTINNQILDVYDETGTFIIDHIVVWDIEYIVRAATILLAMSFVFKMFLVIIRGLMKFDFNRD